MTRTDVMASSRPRTTADAASMGRGSRRAWRVLAALPLVLALALALVVPGAAFAAEPTSKYNQEPTKPSTGTSPSKETKSTPTTTTPAAEVAPTKTATTPTTTEKATTLPFTGFDLRWDVGIGLLLMLAGVSIVIVQRRQRRASRR